MLLAEDEPAVRRLACKVLTQEGYVVLEAANGRAALEILDTYDGPIDLLFADAVMPEMGASELIRAMQKRGRHSAIKVLVTSGYTREDIGESRLLEKPYSMEQLARAVREALDG